MCCVITILLALGPRSSIVAWWLLRPAAFDRAFDGALAPILGLVLFPWATLAYVWAAPGGVNGLEWALLAAAFLLDFSVYSGACSNRARFRGG